MFQTAAKSTYTKTKITKCRKGY